MSFNLRNLEPSLKVKDLSWHKKEIKKSEDWARELYKELGLTVEDVRFLSKQKRAH